MLEDRAVLKTNCDLETFYFLPVNLAPKAFGVVW